MSANKEGMVLELQTLQQAWEGGSDDARLAFLVWLKMRPIRGDDEEVSLATQALDTLLVCLNIAVVAMGRPSS